MGRLVTVVFAVVLLHIGFKCKVEAPLFKKKRKEKTDKQN